MILNRYTVYEKGKFIFYSCFVLIYYIQLQYKLPLTSSVTRKPRTYRHFY